ncbi:MAG: ABC transporter permease, partial [Bdellovibrionales bacterium]|nr:ABC transporter permease [Bdellovibrionales bacterium]
MFKYIVSRLASGCMTVFFLATVTFFAMHLVPGDPLMSQKAVSEEVRQNLMEQYGLDRPLLEQYGLFLSKMIRGDFGISFTQQNRSVNDIIREHFPVSAMLGMFAIVIAAVGGILWGSLTALKRNQWSDRVIMFGVILCVSVPSFVIAAMVQFLISEINKAWNFELLPVAGWGTFQHMILPALILGLGT